MTLRTRIALIAALAVALAVAAASVGLFLATAQTLRASVDRSLVEIASGELPARIGPDFHGGPRVGRYGGAGGTVQVVSVQGVALTPRQGGEPVDPLPVTERTIAVAAGTSEPFFETVQVGDVPLRILTVPAGNGLAVQFARPLTEVEGVLADLRRQLTVASLLGVVLAAGLGMMVSRRAVRPVGELTRLAEEVAATQDLTRRLSLDRRDDEIGRLAGAFDHMLAELEQARSSQAQLVADASHELRTPLTSLRTNVEVLAQLERLDPDERQRLVDDVVDQIDEFSQLIGGLVELARGEEPVQAPTRLRLDEIAARAADRLDPNGARLRLRCEPVEVVGDPDRIERAVANLAENALKYAPDGDVEVEVAPTFVRVRDHGPGVDPADLPHLFKRFYRAAGARGAPGAGLGLAIVDQVATSHGGRVEVADAPGGGAVFTLHLPAAA